MADSTIRLTITTAAEQTLAALNNIRSQIGQLTQNLGSVTGASAAAATGLSAATAAAAAAGAAMAGVSAGATAATAGEVAATAGAAALSNALSDTADAGSLIDGNGMDDLAAAARRAESNLTAAAAAARQVSAQRSRIESLASAIASAAVKGAKWAAITGLQQLRRAAVSAGRGVRDLGKDLALAAINGGKWLAARSIAVLKTSAVALGGALAAAGTAAVVFGAKQEQTRLKLEVMLGSVEKANALLGQMQKFANVTPFNTAEVVSAGQTLLGFGVAAGDVVSQIKMLGDISAGTGKDLNELASIYGKTLAKGKVETEQLNQITEAGIPIIRTLAAMYGVSEGAVYDMAARGKISAADLQKAFEKMTASGGIFGGMMEKQSKTVGGLWSTFIGNLQTIAGTVGEQLAPVMRLVLDYLVSWSDRVNELAQNGTLLEWIGKIATSAVTALTEIAKWSVTIVNYGIAAVKTIIGWGDMLWAGIKTGFWSLVAFVTDGITNIINGILKAYNWVVTKFGGTEVGLLNSNTEEMWSAAGEAYNATSAAAGRALDGRYFSEAMENNKAFDQAADKFAAKINAMIDHGVAEGKKQAEKRKNDTENGKLESGKQPVSASRVLADDSRRMSDSLTKIGGYNFGLNSVNQMDKERNKLLGSILTTVEKIKNAGGALA